MKRSSSDTAERKLNMALFSYHITPQATRGLSPSEMLTGRKLRCKLDLIHPDLKKKVEAKPTSQKAFQDKRARERNFVAGEPVYTKNYGYGPKWIPGLIHETTGPVSYTVLLGDGKLVRRHVDQLFSRLGAFSSESRSGARGGVWGTHTNVKHNRTRYRFYTRRGQKLASSRAREHLLVLQQQGTGSVLRETGNHQHCSHLIEILFSWPMTTTQPSAKSQNHCIFQKY